MSYYSYDLDSFRYISHHGILGQKWGVRRYQNKDGTLTELGKKHKYTELHSPSSLKEANERSNQYNKSFNKARQQKEIEDVNDSIAKLKISNKDKDSLRLAFAIEREHRRYKRDIHYGSLDDDELIELLQMEMDDAVNHPLVEIGKRYSSEKVNQVIKNIKSFDTYTDGLYSDKIKGNEYMFDDDYLNIRKNRLK